MLFSLIYSKHKTADVSKKNKRKKHTQSYKVNTNFSHQIFVSSLAPLKWPWIFIEMFSLVFATPSWKPLGLCFFTSNFVLLCVNLEQAHAWGCSYLPMRVCPLWHHTGMMSRTVFFSAVWSEKEEVKWKRSKKKQIVSISRGVHWQARDTHCFFLENTGKSIVHETGPSRHSAWLIRHRQTSLFSSVSDYPTTCLRFLFLLLLLKYRLLISHVT